MILVLPEGTCKDMHGEQPCMMGIKKPLIFERLL